MRSKKWHLLGELVTSRPISLSRVSKPDKNVRQLILTVLKWKHRAFIS